MNPVATVLLQDMSESGDVWAALTTLAATTNARRQGVQAEVVAEVEAVAGAVGKTEIEAEAEAEAEMEAEAEREAEAETEAEAEAEAEAETVTETEDEAEAKAKAGALNGTSCNGPQVSRFAAERAAGWTDFRGLVTSPLLISVLLRRPPLSTRWNPSPATQLILFCTGYGRTCQSRAMRGLR